MCRWIRSSLTCLLIHADRHCPKCPHPNPPPHAGEGHHPRSAAWPDNQISRTSVLDQLFKTRSRDRAGTSSSFPCSRGKSRNFELLPPRAGEGRDGGVSATGKSKTTSSFTRSRGKSRNFELLPLQAGEGRDGGACSREESKPRAPNSAAGGNSQNLELLPLQAGEGRDGGA